RVLRHEINSNALGSDEPDDLFNLLEQRFRSFVEKQMCLVKEEHEFGLLQISGFWQLFKQFREQPQQKRRVELRVLEQLVGRENVHDASALGIRLHQVVQV